MNRGDSRHIFLNITSRSGEPISPAYGLNEIELTFNKNYSRNCIKKTLSNGDITWSEKAGKYEFYLSQSDTFKLLTENTWQIRVLKDDVCVSNSIGAFVIGDVNSNEVL